MSDGAIFWLLVGLTAMWVADCLLLAAAFMFWAIDQVMPAGRVAVFIGDVVIAAYVLDLFWMLGDQQKERAAGSGDGI